MYTCVYIYIYIYIYIFTYIIERLQGEQRRGRPGMLAAGLVLVDLVRGELLKHKLSSVMLLINNIVCSLSVIF